MSFDTLIPALPEIFLALTSLALLMVGVFAGERSTRLVTWLAVAAFVVTAILLWQTAPDKGRAVIFAGMFATSGFALVMKLVVLAASAIGLILSIGYNEREGIDRFEFPALIVLATLGMMMMISANDLISLYIGLELQSLSLYVIAAFKRDQVRSSEAGLKYFILGALSSGMLLYGASMIYGFAGTTNFAALADVFARSGQPGAGIIVGLVFVMVGLAFKISAFPFHMWSPDVYEGAPTSVTAYFAAAPKLAAMTLFISVLMGPFGKLVGQWQQILVLVAIGSMVLGAFAAIPQSNIKRLLAYSSIGHVGFALVGLATGTADGVRAVIIYMIIYAIMTLGGFACVLAMRRQGRAMEQISDLSGLSKTNPALALWLAIFMFSMAGIPPLAGFFGKFYIFLSAIQAGMITLAVIGVLASVVAAYYYLRVVKIMYFDEPQEGMDTADSGLRLVQSVAAALVLLFFLFPMPLTRLADIAVRGLTGS